MELFIDSADSQEIQKYFDIQIFKGVTTTPTFFFNKGIRDYTSEVQKIVHTTGGNVHIEAMGKSTVEIIEQATKNSSLHENIVSKIPITSEGLKAAKKLKSCNIKTNIHLIFSLNQALLALETGTDYICPLFGRLNDIGENALKIIEDIVRVIKNYNYSTKLMASSIRGPKDVADASILGVDAITIPSVVLETMLFHPLTKRGQDIFEKDVFLMSCVEQVMRGGEEMPLLEEDSPLHEALKIMSDKKIGLCIVIDNNQKLKGILTDGDIRRLLANSRQAIDEPLKQLINAQPLTILPGNQVADALKVMELKRITTLIVTDKDDKPLGFLNLHDILAKIEL